MLGLNWRKRALEAEKQLAQATAALSVMNERLAEKAILLSRRQKNCLYICTQR